MCERLRAETRTRPELYISKCICVTGTLSQTHTQAIWMSSWSSSLESAIKNKLENRNLSSKVVIAPIYQKESHYF